MGKVKLTVLVDSEVKTRARVRALQDGVTFSSVVEAFLLNYALGEGDTVPVGKDTRCVQCGAELLAGAAGRVAYVCNRCGGEPGIAVACPICGNTSARYYHVAEMVRCPTCGRSDVGDDSG